MRKCPYCQGKMITGGDGFLRCADECQHRTCSRCEVPIHFDSISNPLYLDAAGYAACYYNPETETGMEHMP